MEILKFPNSALFKRCEPVTVFGDELRILLQGMFDTMKTHNGMGLAANQVGIMYRMFVMEGPKQEKLFLVNPVISSSSIASANLREGCLSAPGEFLVLPERKGWVEVNFQDESGNQLRKVFSGIHAVCAQHEIDHLNGKSHLQSPNIPREKRKELKKKWGLK